MNPGRTRTGAAVASRLLIAALLCLSQAAGAHLLNMSKARVSLLPDGRVELRLSLDLLVTAGDRQRYYRLSQLENPLGNADVRALLAPLPGAIELTLGETRLPLELVAVRFPAEPLDSFLDPLSWPRTELELTARLPAPAADRPAADLRVRYTGAFRFEEPIANTIEDLQTGRSQTRWLVTEQSSPVFDASVWRGMAASPTAPGTDWAGLRSFLQAGFSHIIPAGVDHLLFVAALCLGASSLRGLLGVITVFTLAHSITLAAMALGWLSLPASLVEPVIILSILWAALANLSRRQHRRMRLLTVLVFGLIHGLGFASALRDIGLPAEQQLLSLLAFNLGVEAGQVLFLLAFLAFLALLRLLRLLTMLSLLAAMQHPGGPAPLLPLAYRRRQLGSGLIALATLMLLAQFPA